MRFLVAEYLLHPFQNIRWRTEDFFYQALRLFSGCGVDVHPGLLRLRDDVGVIQSF